MSHVVNSPGITDAQRAQLEEQGYFIARGLASREAMDNVKALILQTVLERDPSDNVGMVEELNAMPMDEAKARIRKLSRLGRTHRIIWESYYANPNVLAIVRAWLGDEVLLKFDSTFLKPARTGGATPWHQDIGLWRDTNSDAANAWMAVDPATRANGCLQFVPGTHRLGVIPHIDYEDAPHAELPRKLVARTLAETAPHHVELQPGDAVFWHSHLWHFSPPNTSDQSRIGMGGVWVSPAQARSQARMSVFPLAMRDGVPRPFPPEEVQIDEHALDMPVNAHTKLSDIV